VYAQEPRHGATATANKLTDQAGQRVTIEELIATAVGHSPGLAIAHADHDEGRDRNTAADAVDEWHVITRVSGQDTELDRAQASSTALLGTQLGNADAGVERSLSTGGDITATAGAGLGRYQLPPPPANARVAAGGATVAGVTANARVEASQPLLRGAGADVARADQKAARLAARALSAQADDEAAGLVRDLVVGYWELVYAVQTLAVDRDGEALALRQVAITKEVVRAGMQPPSAVKVAELQVALRQEAILRDEMAIGDQSLTVRRLAGLELTSTPLLPGDPLQVSAARWSEDAAVAAALARGPSIAQKQLAQAGADVAVDVAEDGRLPRLDLKLSGAIERVVSSTSPVFGQIRNAPDYSVMASLSLQWDIGGAARAAAGAARAHRARLDAERADLEHQVASSAMSAVRQLRLATRRIELAELAVQVADEALRAEVAAFQGGRSTNVLVFQRQDDVAQAKLRRARAQVDAIEATASLEYLTGGLLARYGVQVEALRRTP
jgi:outer membrane protein TolC